MRPTLVMVAMAVVNFVIIPGLRIAFLAVIAAISVRRGHRAGTSLMSASLDFGGRGICHTIKPLFGQTTWLYPVLMGTRYCAPREPIPIIAGRWPVSFPNWRMNLIAF